LAASVTALGGLSWLAIAAIYKKERGSGGLTGRSGKEATVQCGSHELPRRGVLMSVSGTFLSWWRNLSTGRKVGWVIVALLVLSVLLILWNTVASTTGVPSRRSESAARHEVRI
jgi:hypothetical protein